VGKDSGPSARCVPGTVMCDSVCCSEDRRTASVIALPPGVECLTVDREYVLITVTIVGGARGEGSCMASAGASSGVHRSDS